jgi:CelD/BcsL family acetyltransferase involved in cellulose biosynthesis
MTIIDWKTTRMTNSLPLKIIDPQDPHWLSFLQTRPEAMIFHHPAWLDVLAQSYQYRPFILASRSATGEIQAGLPVMEVNSFLTGRRWVSLPFSDYCPPLAVDQPALEEFTDRLIVLHRQENTPRIELRWQFPDRPGLNTYSQHALHLNQLDPDFDMVYNRIHKRMRKHIRQVERSDLRVEYGTRPEDIRKFYQLQLDTRRRHGVPVQPRRFFELLGSQMLEKGLGFVLTAYQGDRMLAGLVLLHFQQTVTLKYSADTRDYEKLKPNYLLDMTAIRWAHENGFQTIDYGRSALDNIGLRDYKTRLGAAEMPLYYGVIGGDAPSDSDSPLMKIIEPIIRYSPKFVCRAAGEILYRHVG